MLNTALLSLMLKKINIWENKSGSNSRWENSASCDGLMSGILIFSKILFSSEAVETLCTWCLNLFWFVLKRYSMLWRQWRQWRGNKMQFQSLQRFILLLFKLSNFLIFFFWLQLVVATVASAKNLNFIIAIATLEQLLQLRPLQELRNLEARHSVTLGGLEWLDKSLSLYCFYCFHFFGREVYCTYCHFSKCNVFSYNWFQYFLKGYGSAKTAF